MAVAATFGAMPSDIIVALSEATSLAVSLACTPKPADRDIALIMSFSEAIELSPSTLIAAANLGMSLIGIWKVLAIFPKAKPAALASIAKAVDALAMSVMYPGISLVAMPLCPAATPISVSASTVIGVVRESFFSSFPSLAVSAAPNPVVLRTSANPDSKLIAAFLLLFKPATNGSVKSFTERPIPSKVSAVPDNLLAIESAEPITLAKVLDASSMAVIKIETWVSATIFYCCVVLLSSARQLLQSTYLIRQASFPKCL